MAAVDIKSLNEKEVTEFFNSFDTILTDCDGVIWMHMTPLPGASNVLNLFRKLGKKVFYVTNNSTKTRDEFVKKCEALQFEATKEDILCTAHLSACYLKDLGFNKKVYVIGSEAMGKELNDAGIPYSGIGPDPVTPNIQYTSFEKDPDVGAVLVGFDEHFSYPKLVKAATYLNDPKIHFIGTNTDERFPVSQKVVIPGTGSLVRCVESCSDRKAVIMGKPETYLSEVLRKQFNVNPKKTLMIGDRHNTDILLGTRCGFKTLLVLTGVNRLEDINKWKQSNNPEDKEYIPDYYIDALGDLLPHLEKYKTECSK